MWVSFPLSLSLPLDQILSTRPSLIFLWRTRGTASWVNDWTMFCPLLRDWSVWIRMPWSAQQVDCETVCWCDCSCWWAALAKRLSAVDIGGACTFCIDIYIVSIVMRKRTDLWLAFQVCRISFLRAESSIGEPSANLVCFQLPLVLSHHPV